ncbi:MAG: hypothetical protein QOE30_2964 [Mycobacterium sp.]|jgi:hypothetical protein|uniref:hypothetical protein n=1 Tax=Mycobacterium sp. TaxID=1785 RepID=UPI0028B35E2F|nr:hypothetical protein [Mycobacterium sp.]MDT5117225.1 hypothetical protein [Mycobacterium sp.]
MEEVEEQENVERVRFWVDRLHEFVSSFDGIDGAMPIDFCENACIAWQYAAILDPPPLTSPAIFIVLETLGALARVMSAATMDYAITRDVRDRFTRDAVQALLRDALDDILRDGERWLDEGLPSTEEIQERLAAVKAVLQAARTRTKGALRNRECN